MAKKTEEKETKQAKNETEETKDTAREAEVRIKELEKALEEAAAKQAETEDRLLRTLGKGCPPTVGKRYPQTSSLMSGILIHLGPPRPRESSAQGMVWMRMPSSSSRRLVTWLRE